MPSTTTTAALSDSTNANKRSKDAVDDTEAAKKKVKKTLTPYDAYFERMEACMNEKDLIGYKLVRGIFY